MRQLNQRQRGSIQGMQILEHEEIKPPEPLAKVRPTTCLLRCLGAGCGKLLGSQERDSRPGKAAQSFRNQAREQPRLANPRRTMDHQRRNSHPLTTGEFENARVSQLILRSHEEAIPGVRR
jgi:hypothetical protein